MSSFSSDVDDELTEEILSSILLIPYGTRGNATAHEIDWRKFFALPPKARDASIRFLAKKGCLVNPQEIHEEKLRYDHGYFVPVKITEWVDGRRPDVCPKLQSAASGEPVRYCFTGEHCARQYLHAMPGFKSGQYAIKSVAFSEKIV